MPRSLGQLLVEAGHLDEGTLSTLRREAATELELAELIRQRGLVDPKVLLNARAQILGVSCVEINPYSIDPEVVETIPEELARRTVSIPLFRVGNDLTLAIADPTDIMAIDQVRDATGCEVIAVLAEKAAIEEAIRHYYGVDQLLHELIEEARRSEILPESGAAEEEVDLADMAGDNSPTVRLVNIIILKSIRQGASDIHLEPDEDVYRIRFRIDGRLATPLKLPGFLHAGMVSRLKILAGLDLAQKRLPQDGRISLNAEGRRIDLRISTLPTVKGEKVVMRLLDKEGGLHPLDGLGMDVRVLKEWDELIRLPNGILLVTGPTGSGKTTTLYSSLSAINTMDTNIVTVEDPVEYDFPLINQVQVNVKAGLSFAAALRSILRQDPNVVMVGEIRDRETASIAIRAALTGHLVLSTLHTNDACGAATRLIDMGVEPYLVASALKGVLSQRLVRRLCPSCAKPVEPATGAYPAGVVERLRREKITPLKAKGCRHCNGSGYKGRLALYELLTVNEALQRAIVQQLPTVELRAIARRSGLPDIFGDGLAKLRAGLIALDELLLATRMMEEEKPTEPAPAGTPEPLELSIEPTPVEAS